MSAANREQSARNSQLPTPTPPADGHCVPAWHQHVGRCWRAGWAAGYAAAQAEQTARLLDQAEANPDA